MFGLYAHLLSNKALASLYVTAVTLIRASMGRSRSVKTLGIIGGMGPDTTSEFYLKLVNCHSCLRELARPPILISSVPLEYALEKEVIVNSRRLEEYLPILIKAAQGLERGGADFLVMPCCSLHLFIEELRQAVSIPMLSIIDEVGAFFHQKDTKRVAVLGTKVTVSNQLFSQVFAKQGIQEVCPFATEQELLSMHIHRLVISGASSESALFLKELLYSLSDRGASHALLACTDLQLVIDSEMSVLPIVDSLELLLDATKRELFEAAAS